MTDDPSQSNTSPEDSQQAYLPPQDPAYQPPLEQAYQHPAARDQPVHYQQDPNSANPPQGYPAQQVPQQGGAHSAQQGGPQPGAPHYSYSAPFSDATATMPKASAGGGKAALWAVLGAVGALLILGVGFIVYKSLQDPFRTLDTFPTEKYLSNYENVVGSRFRASLSVDAELGGSFEKGRILTFREETTQKSLAILVPPDLAQIGFSKGQSYVAELEVVKGGLIHAHGFKKN